MTAPPTQPPARSAMSLYANLLDSGDSSASISRDPVLFKDEAKDDTPAKKAIDPALRFQPIRRPQVKQPSKPKPTFPKAPPAIPAGVAAASGNAPTPAQPRSKLADWAATEEDEYLYGTGEKRQRGGRRKKKKKAQDVPVETDWDEIYDPARPTNVEEYLHSEERIREVQEWKAALYAHRRQRRRSSHGSDLHSDEEDRARLGNQFAPPASLNFAPPPPSPPRATATAAPIADDATGDDAYARRLALSGKAAAPPPPAAASPTPPPPPPPPPPGPPESEPPPPPQQPQATPTDSATISRAPVRYEPPPAQPTSEMDLDEDDDQEEDLADDGEVDYSAIPLPPPPDDAPTTTSTTTEQPAKSTLPGQAGFAQRLMAKYGWTKGTGLGASQSGITSALRVQVEKRRRRPDAEGGGFAEPGGARGRIIAPKPKQPKRDNNNQDGEKGEAPGSKFGRMSNVVVLRRMLDNMPDLEAEIEAGLGQEIGEECGERYGRVERLFIDVAGGGRVFIKFTDGVSALRAVNALEGRIFNGNSIVARFYDADKFEEGVYDDDEDES